MDSHSVLLLDFLAQAALATAGLDLLELSTLCLLCAVTRSATSVFGAAFALLTARRGQCAATLQTISSLMRLCPAAFADLLHKLGKELLVAEIQSSLKPLLSNANVNLNTAVEPKCQNLLDGHKDGTSS
jgi:hypothetical protein